MADKAPETAPAGTAPPVKVDIAGPDAPIEVDDVCVPPTWDHKHLTNSPGSSGTMTQSSKTKCKKVLQRMEWSTHSSVAATVRPSQRPLRPVSRTIPWNMADVITHSDLGVRASPVY